jgi:Icc-related predicted phosphoesterase
VKILCVSDQIDPLVYTANITTRFADVDFVLAAGDLPLDYLEFIVSMLNKPVYYVFGNHDLKHYRQIKYGETSPETKSEAEIRGMPGAGAVHLGGHVAREKVPGTRDVVLLAGLGGTLLYNNGDNQYTEFQMRCRILRLFPKLLLNKIRYGRWLDILLTHAPPLGLGDRDDPCHRGFDAFKWFIRKFKPRYLLYGHIHLYDMNDTRVRSYEGTTLINVFSHYVLEFQ